MEKRLCSPPESVHECFVTLYRQGFRKKVRSKKNNLILLLYSRHSLWVLKLSSFWNFWLNGWLPTVIVHDGFCSLPVGDWEQPVSLLNAASQPAVSTEPARNIIPPPLRNGKKHSFIEPSDP